MKRKKLKREVENNKIIKAWDEYSKVVTNEELIKSVEEINKLGTLGITLEEYINSLN